MRIKRKEIHKKTGYFLRGMAAVFAAAALSIGIPSVSLADSAGTVAVESAKIRGSADADSEVVGSASRGAKVTIKEEVQDASGTLWYQVYVDANTMGYIRADLVNKEGGSDGNVAAVSAGSGTDNAAQGGAESSDANQADSGAAAPAGGAMEAQYANVSVEVAKIRSAPSTNDSIVDRLEKGRQVTVTGQADGSSDGKVWYYITFTGTDNAEKTGYVRSDLVTLGDMVPVPVEEPAPEEPAEPEPQETVRQDYEVAFKEGEWYLIDNVGGYEQKLQPLLDADSKQDEEADENAKKLVRQRIWIVVLAVLAVILLIAVIIMAVKLRDVYYEEYEDDEEEEDDGGAEEADDVEEEAAVRRRRRAEEEENVKSSERSSRSAVRESEVSTRRPAREPEGRSVRGNEPPARAAAKRKAKNFLTDDDDFEFGFLNMDDKDI